MRLFCLAAQAELALAELARTVDLVGFSLKLQCFRSARIWQLCAAERAGGGSLGKGVSQVPRDSVHEVSVGAAQACRAHGSEPGSQTWPTGRPLI